MDTEKLRPYLIPIASGYALLIAAMYNGSYWLRFGVNILEFATLNDLIAMSVIPVATTSFGFLASMVLADLPSIIRGRMRWWVGLGVPLIYFASLLFMGFMFSLLLVFTALFVIASVGAVDWRIFRSRSQGTLIGFAMLLPFWAYWGGDNAAEDILNGRKYKFIVVDGREHRFLGHVGGNMFFLSMDPPTLVIKSLNDAKSLELQYFPSLPPDKMPWEKWFGDGSESEPTTDSPEAQTDQHESPPPPPPST